MLLAGVVAATAAVPTDALVDNPGGKKQRDRQALLRDFPGLSIAVPAGWDLYPNYWRPALDSHVTFLSRSSNNKFGFTFLKPPRVVFDPRKHRAVRLRPTFLKWIVTHPHLKTTAIKTIRIAGFPAQMVDGRVRSTDSQGYHAGFCGETTSQRPCVPLTADKGPEGFVTLEVTPRGTNRFITARLPHGRKLFILIQADGGPALVNAAMKILGTLQLK